MWALGFVQERLQGLEGAFVTAGDSETGGARDRSNSRARRLLSAPRRVREQGALGMGSGGTWRSCHCPAWCSGGWLLGSLVFRSCLTEGGEAPGAPGGRQRAGAFRGDLRGGGPVRVLVSRDWSAPVIVAGGVAPGLAALLGLERQCREATCGVIGRSGRKVSEGRAGSTPSQPVV